jgi:outer membrane protein OmpA-like peptidoglycan-associated protein
MLSSGSGGQPKRAGRPVQAGCGLESGTSGLRWGHFAPLCVLTLAGCSSFPSSMNPVSWWHGLQGGKIAEERPPPPGADQPYPNLATVPPKPALPDRAALDNIASALIADRTNAQHVAAAAPIADPSVPSASPALFGRGTVPPPPPASPPGPAKASATMAAAEAPPAPATPAPNQPTTAPATAPPPAKAPVGAVQSAPLAPPGAAAQPPSVQAAAPPPLPAAPPAPPNLPGVPQATASSAPAGGSPGPGWKAEPPPPPTATKVAAATPTSPPPAKSAGAANAVSVTFVAGSAELQTFAADTLKQLAARRGNGIIAVTGYGDATSDDPAIQSAALTLGLSRAKAMAAALTSAGVPASAVQVDAAAIGRGGAARLVQ